MKKNVLVWLGVCTIAAGMLAGCGSQKGAADSAQSQQQAQESTAQATTEAGAEASTEAAGEEAGESMVGLANPWVDITEDVAKETCARLFKAPEGAEIQGWSMCEALGDPDKNIGPLIQLAYSLDGKNFNARAQYGAAEDTDIAGNYFDWTVGPEDVTLANWGEGHMQGKTYRHIGETGYVDQITWYDIEVGISYSLSVAAADLDGFDIQAIAEQMYPGDEAIYGDIPDDDDAATAAIVQETADGFYGATMQASEKDKVGTQDDYGVFYKIVYDGHFDGDSLIISGSMDYRNFQGQDSITVSDDQAHVFTVDDNTVYQLVGGEVGPEIITKEDFGNYLKDVIDSGLFLEIEISGGVVKTASMMS